MMFKFALALWVVTFVPSAHAAPAPVTPQEDGEPTDDLAIVIEAAHAVLEMPDDETRVRWLQGRIATLTDRRAVALRLRAAASAIDLARRFGPLTRDKLVAWLRAALSKDTLLRDAALSAAAFGANPPSSPSEALSWPDGIAGGPALRRFMDLRATLVSCQEVQFVSQSSQAGLGSDRVVAVSRIYIQGWWRNPRNLAWILQNSPRLADLDLREKVGGRAPVDATYEDLASTWNDRLRDDLQLDRIQTLEAIRAWRVPQGWPEYGSDHYLGTPLGCTED